MEWSIVAGRPVYLQLIEQLELAIVVGEYPPGEKIPGVRDLAAQAQVNPNTMQRALAELEARGLLETQRTAGRTVTGDVEKIAQTRRALAQTLVHHFIIRRQRSASQSRNRRAARTGGGITMAAIYTANHLQKELRQPRRCAT